MANTNSPYIAKNAAPLVNPTTASLFTTMVSAIATVASTQVLKPAFVKYACYAAGGAGTSNNINIVRIAVRASGRVTTGASSTFTPAIVLFNNTGSAPALTTGFTQLAALTPATFATNSGNWYMDLNMAWDPTSGYVGGTYSGAETNGAGATTLTASAAFTPAGGYTLVPPATTLPTTPAQAAAVSTGELALFFGVTGLVGTGNAATTAYLDNFEIEVL